MKSAIVILMAGRSRRMGQPKAIVEIRGQPTLTHPLNVARAVNVGDVVLVLGPDRDVVQAAVDTSGARVVVNADPDRGLASSLAAGVRAAGPDVERVAVLLGDRRGADRPRDAQPTQRGRLLPRR